MTKIIVYNLEYGTNVSSLWGYFNPLKHLWEERKLVEKISSDLNEYTPDILGLVEVDHGSIRARLKSQILRFANQLGFDELHYDRKYRKMYGYVPILQHQYNALLSKKPLTKKMVYFLKKGMKKAVLIGETDKYVFLVVHLVLNRRVRSLQIKELIELVNSLKKKVVLMGDFNCEPSSIEMRYLLEQTKLKISNDFPTFPQWEPNKKLDYILVDKSVEIISSEVLQLPYSDHLPILVELKP